MGEDKPTNNEEEKPMVEENKEMGQKEKDEQSRLAVYNSFSTMVQAQPSDEDKKKYDFPFRLMKYTTLSEDDQEKVMFENKHLGNVWANRTMFNTLDNVDNEFSQFLHYL